MNLDTAIEILELNLKEAGKQMPADTRDALLLAVEALKREERNRKDPEFVLVGPLPDETHNGTQP